MKLAGIFSKVVGGSASTLIDSIGNAIDKNITNKGEREAIKLELQKEINRNTEALISEGNKELELHLKDLDSARNRESTIATSEHAPLINKIISPVLALLILGSTFLMWYFILFKDVPKEKEVLVSGIIGSLTTLSMGVVSYFFGSSQGSASKDKQLEKLYNK